MFMDEIGVMNLIEEFSVLIEDSKPVFGKNTMRQVDARQHLRFLMRSVTPSPQNSHRRARSFVNVKHCSTKLKLKHHALSKMRVARLSPSRANRRSCAFPSSRPIPSWLKRASSSAKRVQVRKTSLMKCSRMSSRASILRSTACVVAVTA